VGDFQINKQEIEKANRESAFLCLPTFILFPFCPLPLLLHLLSLDPPSQSTTSVLFLLLVH
jgi:hypothetical protein